MKEYYIEVYSKGRDMEGERIEQDLRDLNISGVEQVKFSKIYILSGDLGDKAGKILQQIAGELLADPVSEDFSMCRKNGEGIEITVFFNPGVLDVEGNRILEALKFMGVKEVCQAKSAKKYTIKASKELSIDTCRFFANKLLYNKIIETVRIKSASN